MFEKLVVVDCRAHMLGRLASIVAKELLNGQHVVLVRAEEMNISGSLFRNQIKWSEFRRKRHNTNPKRGPIHHRSPAKMVYRTIRGMVPHKLARGAAAMSRLKVFVGIPSPYDKMKRQVIPDALRVTRLKPGRDFCVMGDLATFAGWKHYDLVKRLEATRKSESNAFYLKKKEAAKARATAAAEL